jgi:hypothetical protein
MAEVKGFYGRIEKIDFSVVNLSEGKLKQLGKQKIDSIKKCVCSIKLKEENKKDEVYRYDGKAWISVEFSPRAFFKLKCKYMMSADLSSRVSVDEFKEILGIYIPRAYREISLIAAMGTSIAYGDPLIEAPQGFDITIDSFDD